MEDNTNPSGENSPKEAKLSHWNAVDERCDKCGQVTKVARGITKQNLKRLLFAKPGIQDIMIFVMLVMVLLIAWRYNIETASARDTLNNLPKICMDYCSVTPSDTNLLNSTTNITSILLSNLTNQIPTNGS